MKKIKKNKNRTFCYISVENCMQKYGQEGFCCLCGTQTSKWLTWLNWCKWFSKLDLDILSMLAVSCGITLIFLNQYLDLIAIKFSWSSQPWSIIQWEISSTKLCKPPLTHLINQSILSIHCRNLAFFGPSVVFFTFLEMINHSRPKM